MRYSLIICYLALLGIITTIGCGWDSGKTQPAASIGGSDEGAAKSKADESGSKLSKSKLDFQHPEVLIDTSLGKIIIRLDAEKAPLTVDNFLAYVDAVLYDQTIFHQIYKDQGILAGGYTTNLSEIHARPAVRNEAHNGRKNQRGTIAMVRQPDAIDSATSQFFINVADNPALDHRDRTPEQYGYCVFGEVISGMEVVDQIAAVQVQDTDKFDSTPLQTVVVKSIRRGK